MNPLSVILAFFGWPVVLSTNGRFPAYSSSPSQYQKWLSGESRRFLDSSKVDSAIEEFSLHLQPAENGFFSCSDELCKEPKINVENLRDHYVKYHLSGKMYACILCKEQFCLEACCVDHIQDEHIDVISSTNVINRIDVEESNSSSSWSNEDNHDQLQIISIMNKNNPTSSWFVIEPSNRHFSSAHCSSHKTTDSSSGSNNNKNPAKDDDSSYSEDNSDILSVKSTPSKYNLRSCNPIDNTNKEPINNALLGPSGRKRKLSSVSPESQPTKVFRRSSRHNR